MKKRVIVWGTGNVGRPAIRAVLSHRDLELTGVVVNNPAKAGRDVGEFTGLEATGVIATSNWQELLDTGADAVVYCATADTRPEAAMADLLACLTAGINVVTPAFYSFLHPASVPAELTAVISRACDSGASLFVSGIDPGWAMDWLPIVASGASSDIREVRCREIFNYALYDAPEVVRDVIGFGGDMNELPLMLHDFAIEMVWGPMVRLVAEGLGESAGEVSITVDRLALERDVEVPGMGLFEAGSQGAFRFEVAATAGNTRFVLEHITRIDEACAPGWPYPPTGGGCHQVIVTGNPTLHLNVHAEDAFEPGLAGGGNASAACWLVNAIPSVCAARQGLLTVLDLPRISGARQLHAAGC